PVPAKPPTLPYTTLFRSQDRGECVDHRGKWHREGTYCPGTPPSLPPPGGGLYRGGHGFYRRKSFRKRTLWPCEGLLYRRQGGSGREVRGRPPGHPLFG